jgi:prophage tail gpP-like protein
MSDDLTLTVNGESLSGWTEVRVTRGIERCPSDFDILMTDLAPGDATGHVVAAGDPCTVSLGADLVLTGYVDKVEPSYDSGRHEIRVSGRGKCQDLVDCSAEWPGGQISGVDALQIAQDLATPYGIDVQLLGPDSGKTIPQFNLMLGETAYEIIERVCRFAGFLCYEDAYGNLVLARASTVSAASGFTEGKNILSGAAAYSVDQQYSEYDCFLMAMDVLSDIGEGGNLVFSLTNPDIARHRKLYIIADAGSGGLQLAQDRATWEGQRRRGRGLQLTLTVDSWRDSAGKLWEPNTTAPVSVPNLHWTRTDPPLIGSVSFMRDAKGTRAEVVLMPPEAFTLEPILLQPIVPDLNQAPPPSPGSNQTGGSPAAGGANQVGG